MEISGLGLERGEKQKRKLSYAVHKGNRRPRERKAGKREEMAGEQEKRLGNTEGLVSRKKFQVTGSLENDLRPGMSNISFYVVCIVAV